MKVALGMIQGSDVRTIFNISQKIPVSLAKIDIPRALEIPVRHDLYACDAYFLDCCLALSSPLMTLDTRLKTAAATMNIEILE